MGPSVGQTGPCVYNRGPLLVREGALVGPIGPSTVKKYFPGQRSLPSLNARGSPSVIGETGASWAGFCLRWHKFGMIKNINICLLSLNSPILRLSK